MVTLKGSSEGKSTSWADVFPFNLKIQIYNYSWTVANCTAGWGTLKENDWKFGGMIYVVRQQNVKKCEYRGVPKYLLNIRWMINKKHLSRRESTEPGRSDNLLCGHQSTFFPNHPFSSINSLKMAEMQSLVKYMDIHSLRATFWLQSLLNVHYWLPDRHCSLVRSSKHLEAAVLH